MEFLINLWDLFVDMSFYITIGLIFTGILHAFVNKDAILKHIGKKNTSSVVKASVLGVPLPLCSCGVVPTAMYLGKSGASKGAVVSFLTSTPQTGVDSIVATYGLMGPLFAAYRAVAAFISGIFSGIVTNIFCKNDDDNFEKASTSCACSSKAEEAPTCGCSSKVEEAPTCGCSSKAEEAPTCGCSSKVEEAPTCGCSSKVEEAPTCGCSSKVEEAPTCGCSTGASIVAEAKPTFFAKIKSIFTYAFGSFLDEIAVNFVIGLIIAALISTFVPETWLSSFTNPLVSMLIMLVIGIPMYICSTASIPIALSLMMKGVSPGAAFVFLFAGPVTNIASLAILGKSLGKKVLTIYLACAAVCAIIFGFVLDYIIDISGYTGLTNIVEHAHEHHTPIYMIAVSVIFGLLVLWSLIRKFLPKKTKTSSCCSQ